VLHSGLLAEGDSFNAASMLKDLQQLLVLQDRDTNLQKLEADMRQIPKDVEREASRLKQDQAALDTAKQELQKLEVEAGKVKLDRRTRQDTLEKLRVQMFETKKNEEYAALGAEADRYETIVGEYETEELELLEKCDSQKVVVEQKTQALVDRKAMVASNVAELKDKAKIFVAKFKEAKVERASAASGVEEEALGLYDRVFKSKKDFAVVEILHGEVCSGCHITVVASTLSKLRADNAITQCENCARILFER